jgi:ligand-binding SRPBCC domain-containing protein
VPTTYHLQRRQHIPRPLAEVFPFFADVANLEAITPPSLHFRILTPLPIQVQSGTLIEYRLALFGVPFRWSTRIETFEPPHRFVDTQVRGPYRLWRHTHEFWEQDGGTWMSDRIEYQLPWGPLGWLAHRLFVERQLACIFDYRFRVIERTLAESRSSAETPFDGFSSAVT